MCEACPLICAGGVHTNVRGVHVILDRARECMRGLHVRTESARCRTLHKCGGGRRALENCFWVAAAAANTLLESVLYSYFTGLSGDRGIGLAPPGGQLEKLQCEKRSADVTSVGGIGASPSHTCFTVCSRLVCFVRHSVRPSRFTIVSVRSLCAECRAFCVASAWQLSVVASVDRHVPSPRVLSCPVGSIFPLRSVFHRNEIVRTGGCSEYGILVPSSRSLCVLL